MAKIKVSHLNILLEEDAMLSVEYFRQCIDIAFENIASLRNEVLDINTPYFDLARKFALHGLCIEKMSLDETLLLLAKLEIRLAHLKSWYRSEQHVKKQNERPYMNGGNYLKMADLKWTY